MAGMQDTATNDDPNPVSISLALGELERAVLECLWSEGELSTPDVYERVGRPRGLAYTTILTVLQRLARKGLTLRKEVGKGHVHSPTLNRTEFARRRGEDLASLVTELGAAGIAAFFAEAERLDPATLAQLREQLRASQ